MINESNDVYPRWWMTTTTQSIRDDIARRPRGPTATTAQILLALEEVYRHVIRMEDSAPSPEAYRTVRAIAAFEILRECAPHFFPFHGVLRNVLSEVPPALFTMEKPDQTRLEEFDLLRREYTIKLKTQKNNDQRKNQNVAILNRMLDLWGKDDVRRCFKSWNTYTKRHRLLKARYQRIFATSSLRMSVTIAIRLWKRCATAYQLGVRTSAAIHLKDSKMGGFTMAAASIRKQIGIVNTSKDTLKVEQDKTISEVQVVVRLTEKANTAKEEREAHLAVLNLESAWMLSDMFTQIPIENAAPTLLSWIASRLATVEKAAVSPQLIRLATKTLTDVLSGNMTEKFFDPSCVVYLMYAMDPDMRNLPLERVREICALYDLRTKGEHVCTAFKDVTNLPAPLLPQDLIRGNRTRVTLLCWMLQRHWVVQRGNGPWQRPEGDPPIIELEKWHATRNATVAQAKALSSDLHKTLVGCLSDIVLEIQANERDDDPAADGVENTERLLRRAFSEIEAEVLETIDDTLAEIPVSFVLKENYKMLHRAYQKYAKDETGAGHSSQEQHTLGVASITLGEVLMCLTHADLLPAVRTMEQTEKLTELYDDVVAAEVGSVPHVTAFSCCFLMASIWKYRSNEEGGVGDIVKVREVKECNPRAGTQTHRQEGSVGDIVKVVRQGIGALAGVLLDRAAEGFQTTVGRQDVDEVVRSHKAMILELFEQHGTEGAVPLSGLDALIEELLPEYLEKTVTTAVLYKAVTKGQGPMGFNDFCEMMCALAAVMSPDPFVAMHTKVESFFQKLRSRQGMISPKNGIQKTKALFNVGFV